MTGTTTLRLIQHADIDARKWNSCIDKANNCRVYAYTWHLDRVALQWNALVLGDYEYVMPLPYHKIFGIEYIYQPEFSQQLGIYPTPAREISDRFYQRLQTDFHCTNLSLNAGNLPGREITGMHFSAFKNYLLPLGNDYQTTSSFFDAHTQYNIEKSESNQLTWTEGIRLETFLEFKKQNLPPNFRKRMMNTLRTLVAYGQYQSFGEVYGVYSTNNELCAAIYFCRWKDRVVRLDTAISRQGEELGALYFLLHQFIKSNAGKNLILDFSGTAETRDELFFHGFGATPETYFQLKSEQLPFLLKWIG